MSDIYAILKRLGIGARYRGHRYLALSISMVMDNEDYLFLATKRLYPDVARAFGTTWSCVERDMRTAIQVSWRRNRPYLEELATYPLDRKPKPMDFIGMVASHLLRQAVNSP